MIEYIVSDEHIERVNMALLAFGRVKLDFDGMPEIVRCRDCRHWATERRFTFGCVGKSGKPDPDGYCAWGERRES